MQCKAHQYHWKSGELSIKLVLTARPLLDRAALAVPSADALGPFINIILNPNHGKCMSDWSYIKEDFAVAGNKF
jgi:hypothetical protein